MKLNKSEVARRQLGTALHLFLHDADPVSVHTLACSGGEIAEYLIEKSGSKPFLKLAQEHHGLKHRQLKEIRNQNVNAFKHAFKFNLQERDDDKTLEKFDDVENDHILFISWLDYVIGVGGWPIEVNVFFAWHRLMYPEMCGVPSGGEAEAERLKTLSRSDTKAFLRDLIERARADVETMSDPGIDPRPLVLGRDA